MQSRGCLQASQRHILKRMTLEVCVRPHTHTSVRTCVCVCVQYDQRVLGAVEAFVVDGDLEELIDTFELLIELTEGDR